MTNDETTNYEMLAKLYAKVFAPAPWNEYTKDRQGCGKFFGLETNPGDPCPECKTTVLEEAYPLAGTIDYINEEMTKPGSRLIVRGEATDPVAFGWGYQENVARLAEEKYKSSEPVRKALENAGIKSDQTIFYLSETGVREDYRNQGIGSAITQALLGLANEAQLDVVMRTNHNSPMFGIAEKSGMSALDVADPDGRLDRVIFVKKARAK